MLFKNVNNLKKISLKNVFFLKKKVILFLLNMNIIRKIFTKM